MENTRTMSSGQAPLPEAGRFKIKVWAEIFDCSVETVRKNVAKYHIRTQRCGGTIVIVAEWWWEALLLDGGGDDDDES